MRAFVVVFACLAAAVSAGSLDGYNYRQGVDTAGTLSGGNYGSSNYGGSSNLGGGTSNYGGSSIDYSSPQYSSGELNKEYYTFTAPEEEFDDPLAAQKLAGALKRNLRVIFIKNPENRGLENAALALARQAAEQQTAIYVLNKQTDVGDLADKFNALRRDTNRRPDVRFVKYRTPEDAANAQRAIQSQYDQLGGLTRNLNGGVAPVLNFASQGPAYRAITKSPESSYLPASIFRRRLR